MPVHQAIENVFLMFYPIFTQPFESVTIVLKDGPNTRSLRHDTDASRYGEPLVLRGAVHELAATISYAVYHGTLGREHRPRERYSVQPSPGGSLSELISPRRGTSVERRIERADPPKARRIAIAWDYRRPSDPKHVPLAGVRHGVSSPFPQLGFTEQDAAASRTESYYMVSKDRLVAEMGIVSNNGWALSSPGELEALHRSLVPRHDRYKCFSFGIGTEHYELSN